MKPFFYYKLKAKQVLRGNLIKPAIVSFFITLISTFVTLYFSMFTTDNSILDIALEALASLLVIQPFSMGSTIFFMKFIEEKDVNVGTVFDGYKYILKLIPYFIIVTLISLGFSLCVDYFSGFILEKVPFFALEIFIGLVIVVFILEAYLSFVFYILYEEKETNGIKAVIKSVKMLKGRILYFIGLHLSFILWILSALFTFGVTLFYTIPYMEFTKLMFYKDIKNSVINNEDIKEEEE